MSHVGNLRKRQTELGLSETRRALGKKIIVPGEKIEVRLTIVRPKPLGRSGGEHFETDVLTEDDWTRIHDMIIPEPYDGIVVNLILRNNTPQDVHALWHISPSENVWRSYGRARNMLNAIFKNAKLPYRFRNTSTKNSSDGVLRARFIKVSQVQ